MCALTYVHMHMHSSTMHTYACNHTRHSIEIADMKLDKESAAKAGHDC